jgi:hypothetical protein
MAILGTRHRTKTSKQHNTTQYNTIQHNTTQYNTIQHNTAQYNTIQHNTTQYRKQQKLMFVAQWKNPIALTSTNIVDWPQQIS